MGDFGRCNYILNLKIAKRDWNSVFLEYTHILPTSEPALNFSFCASTYHIPGCKREGSCPRLANTDSSGSEFLRIIFNEWFFESDGT